nr:hypothetical protein [Allomuricauda sp.]
MDKMGWLLVVMMVLSCSSGGEDSPEPPVVEPPIETINVPAKAVGVLPANGEPCSEYETVPTDASKVLVAFQWNEAQFAQSYVLVALEDNMEVFRDTFTALQAAVELDRGRTYTWRLISRNNDGETVGDTYSFTTPGTPIGNYAPYAAAITLAFDTNTLELSVSWVGSDEDGDTLVYDVTLRENNGILVQMEDLNQDFLDPVPYLVGAEYTVEVISKDPQGNFSVSITNEKAPE